MTTKQEGRSNCMTKNRKVLFLSLALVAVILVLGGTKMCIRDSGKVERSHRKDNEEFYASHRFYSFDDFKAQLAVRERVYNHFPIRPLNWLSPLQVLSSFP